MNTHSYGMNSTMLNLSQNPNLQVGPANSGGGLGRRTMREALEIVQDLQVKYIELNDYVKQNCIDLNKALPIKDINSDDEGLSPEKDKLTKIKKETELDDIDAKELKKIKILKKRRKIQNSMLYAGNLKQWEENIKHKEYCDIKPGS